MKTNNQAENTYTGRPFVIEHTVDATRDVVFQAWTDPEKMKQWFGPKGFKSIVGKLDFRPGGIYHYALEAPDGSRMWGKFNYQEIVIPEKMVFVNAFSDENGGLTRHPMSPTWPIEMLTTVTFTEKNGKTTITIQWLPINPNTEEKKTFEESFDNMKQGWSGTFEQLDEYLASLK